MKEPLDLLDRVSRLLESSYIISLDVKGGDCDSVLRGKLNIIRKKYPRIPVLGGYLVPISDYESLSSVLVSDGDCRVLLYVKKVRIENASNSSPEELAKKIKNVIEDFVIDAIRENISPRIQKLEDGLYRGYHKTLEYLDKWITRVRAFAIISDKIERFLKIISERVESIKRASLVKSEEKPEKSEWERLLDKLIREHLEVENKNL